MILINYFNNIILFFLVFISWPCCSCEQSWDDSLIIYLSGTCSAGKSTLLQSISEQCEIEIIDEDEIMQKRYVEAVAQRFCEKFYIICQAIAEQNLYHALREKDIMFMKSASADDCEKAARALNEIQNELNSPQNLIWKQNVSHRINEKVIQKLKEALEQRKNILLGSRYINEGHLQQIFPSKRILHVLLYCSLSVAYERLLKRNAQATVKEDLSEKRYLRQLLGSFAALYHLTNHNRLAIQCLYRSELNEVFGRISQELPDQDWYDPKPLFTFLEISKPQLIEMKMHFLQPFEQFNTDRLYISSKKEYDLTIDSTNCEVQKAVDAIKEAIGA